MPDEAKELLCEGMNSILTSMAKILTEWKKACIILLPKDSSQDNLANYRPISLLQVMYKVFTKILTNRLMVVANWHILSCAQLGLWKGMSAQSALWALTDIYEDAKHRKEEVHVAYVDFKKAFDSVGHQQLFETLEFYGLGKDFISLVWDLYTECHMDIYLNN